MIIDAHQHIWNLDRVDYPWLGPALAPIDRTLLFDDLAPTLSALGVIGTVLVQAADNAADTDVMLEVFDRTPEVLAVVAWAPLDQPDVFAERLGTLQNHGGVAGIRNLIHERPAEWLLQPQVDASFAILAASGLSYDFVTAGPAALAQLSRIGTNNPELRIVIDHLGKPPIGGSADNREQWRALLAEAARNPLTHAKLSGLYSSVGPLDAWTVEQVRPFVDDALDLFGAERLMFGGDWPIAVLAGGYERTFNGIVSLIDDLSDHERACILGGTAADFYRLNTKES